MAKGALDRSDADVAIAVTGTAESNNELNGVVCFAFVGRCDQHLKICSETVHFNGDRNTVRQLAAEHAINSAPKAHTTLSNQYQQR